MTTIVTRAGKGLPLTWDEVDANFNNLNNDKAENTVVALKAPLASPTFTGTPAAPTASVNTNTTQVATTAFVNAEIANDAVSKSGDTMTGALKNTASQIGTSSTATNNFSLEPTTTGAMKLARGNAGATTQDVMTVATNGKPSFPQLHMSPGADADAQSSFELPNGLIIKSGVTDSVAAGGGLQVNFATAFPTACLSVCITSMISLGSTGVYSLCVAPDLPLVGSFVARNPWTGGSLSGRWIAIGY